MNIVIKGPMFNMLQGLAYWLAYKREIQEYHVIESDAVAEAYHILSVKLQNGFKVRREVPYRNICNCISDSQQRADIAIMDANKQYICVIEFKLQGSANGGYIQDIKKLSSIKSSCSEIDCYSIILFRDSCELSDPQDLITENGYAKRKIDPVIVNSTLSQNIVVRRICKAIGSNNASIMKKVICVELV